MGGGQASTQLSDPTFSNAACTAKLQGHGTVLKEKNPVSVGSFGDLTPASLEG